MAAGRPVIATRVGHVESIVSDGVEGFLVEPGDVQGMANRSLELLLDRGLAARLGAAGRARAAGHDVKTIAAKLLDVLWAAAHQRKRMEVASL
jgi:glycosyltransferase involved in cell wall biosynthesis